METITETFFQKKIILETNDIYSTALEIKDIVSAFGNIIVKKNSYQTDGPRKRVFLSFKVTRPVDKISGAKIAVDINGESNSTGLLSISIAGEFNSFLRFSSGFVSHVFYEYYRDNIFPVLKDETENDTKRILQQIESKINEKFGHKTAA